MKILIDKSSLHGLPIPRLIEICHGNQLCVSEMLIYELLTTDPRHRAMLFRKLHALRQHLAFSGSIGGLLRIEDELGRPSTLVDDAECAIPDAFFHDDLLHPDRDPPEAISRILPEWRERIRSRPASFRQRTHTMTTIFPELEGLRPGERTDIVRGIQQRLSGDSEAVREIVFHLSDEQQRANGTGPEWLGYRMVQAELLWVLDNFHRYGIDQNLEERIDFENTICDVEYATLASKSNLFLSRDLPLVELFQWMDAGVRTVSA